MSKTRAADSAGEATAGDNDPYAPAFGPGFFLNQLSALARDHCPDEKAHLPYVEVHLQDGEILAVCHIIGLASRWVALAVFDENHGNHGRRIRTEMVSYHMITRVTIRLGMPETAHLGFEAHRDEDDLRALYNDHSAEEALQAAMEAPAKTRAAGTEGRNNRRARS